MATDKECLELEMLFLSTERYRDMAVLANRLIKEKVNLF